MTSLSLDHSNNIVAQAISISNQLNNLIQQLNPNNEHIKTIEEIIKKDSSEKNPLELGHICCLIIKPIHCGKIH